MHDEFDEGSLFGAPQQPHYPPGYQPVPAPVPRQEATMRPPANPLGRYFRQPGLHVRLPTDGAFMPQGSIRLTSNMDIPVLPMRAADELMMKSPDGLMSGYAVEQLLQSCVPDILAPRAVSQPDLDVLLLAVRAATYGEAMPVTAICPKCQTENSFDVHLPSLLSTAKPVPPENPVRLTDEVVVYVRPYNVDNSARIGIASFDETRKAQSIDQMKDAKPEEIQRALNASFRRLSDLKVEMTADCVVRVVVPEGEVTDPKAIREFLANISQAWVKRIEAKQTEINGLGIDKKIACKCSKCEHEWKTDLEFNPATFFA
jgi:hypothetical protein